MWSRIVDNFDILSFEKNPCKDYTNIEFDIRLHLSRYFWDTLYICMSSSLTFFFRKSYICIYGIK